MSLLLLPLCLPLYLLGRCHCKVDMLRAQTQKIIHSLDPPGCCRVHQPSIRLGHKASVGD